MLETDLLHRLAELKKAHKTIVLVTGVFDILHQEHTIFLHKAKQLGDFLLVGIESDVRVRAIKGDGRPVNTQSIRAEALRKIADIDEVFILPEEFGSPQAHDQLIAEVRPAFLAVSSHTAHLDKKEAILKKYGGEVKIVHQHNPAVSTTQILAQKKQPNFGST
jgi:rfaE bifunctional protein nucleotidyltransferase chain/domain